MKFKAVMFDLDGTLLNTVEDLADSMNHVLRRFGYPDHDISAYKYFVGDGMEVLVQRALPESHRDQATIDRAVEEMQAVYSRNWAQKTRPYDGIPELLSRCVKCGLQMVVLSNKPDGATKQVVSHFFNPCHFEIVRGARPGVPKKPNPSTALEMAAKLGISPHDFFYLGDTRVDMQTAVSAQMYAVGALWGFREALELVAGGARMLVACPTDLTLWL